MTFGSLSVAKMSPCQRGSCSFSPFLLLRDEQESISFIHSFIGAKNAPMYFSRYHHGLALSVLDSKSPADNVVD